MKSMEVPKGKGKRESILEKGGKYNGRYPPFSKLGLLRLTLLLWLFSLSFAVLDFLFSLPVSSRLFKLLTSRLSLSSLFLNRFINVIVRFSIRGKSGNALRLLSYKREKQIEKPFYYHQGRSYTLINDTKY